MQSKEPTIEQMNKAIAIFDGYMFFKGDPDHKCNFCFAGDEPCTPAVDRFAKDSRIVVYYELKYNTSWDILMPVVKKIPQLIRDTDELDLRRQLTSRWKPIQNELCNVDIRNVHFCVFKFIEWLNQNKPNAE